MDYYLLKTLRIVDLPQGYKTTKKCKAGISHKTV